MTDKKMTRRAQTAMAHLALFGVFHSMSFPLGDSVKYLGNVATEVRRALRNVGSTVAPYRLPNGQRGYIIVPFEINSEGWDPGDVARTMRAYPNKQYYQRELARLNPDSQVKE